MSADLLAEFDAYYAAPKLGNPNIASDGPSASALNDLSIFNPSSSFPEQPEPSGQYRSQRSEKPNLDTLGSFEVGNFRETNRHETQDDFDAWGEFESAIVDTTASQSNTAQGSNEQANSGLQNARLEHEQVTKESRHDPATVTTVTHDSFWTSTSGTAQPSAKGLQTKYPSNLKPSSTDPVQAALFTGNSNVLFDIDNVSDDDDFGDFETVAALPQEQQQGGYLSDNSTIPGFNDTKNPPFLGSKSHQLNPPLTAKVLNSASPQQGNSFAKLNLKGGGIDAKKQRDLASPVTTSPDHARLHSIAELSHYSSGESNTQRMHLTEMAKDALPTKVDKNPSNFINDDSWDWHSVEIMPTNETGLSAKEHPWAWDVVDTHSKEAQISSSSPPPTNIPPPSILLTIFPHLLDLLQSRLFQPVAKQPFSLKSRILSDPSIINFMRAYILLTTVAGRIIAGRKYRWKRDTHLSQSMKIGPAAASGKSGMKLTGVNKAEIGREDREANEFVLAWKDQVGRLRSAIAIANSSIPDIAEHLIVPEINDTMPVHTASAAEGAITALKPCFICGLRRDERISKVDLQVEDSFGEWWIEHWGHKACKNFWLEEGSKLKHS